MSPTGSLPSIRVALYSTSHGWFTACRSLISGPTAKAVADLKSLGLPQLLDRMLLVLHDAMWLKQSEEWSRRGVANMPARPRGENKVVK